jgi:hypothetical protein
MQAWVTGVLRSRKQQAREVASVVYMGGAYVVYRGGRCGRRRRSAGQGSEAADGRKRAVGIPMRLFVREAPRLGEGLARKTNMQDPVTATIIVSDE